MSGYCQACAGLPAGHPDRLYHDHRYGFAPAVVVAGGWSGIEGGTPPLDEEEGVERYLFGLFLLEINQAGLSWSLILRKEPAFRDAYAGFSVDGVAAFGDAEYQAALLNPGIIRNRRKIAAAIENARRIRGLRPQYRRFQDWLDAHHPLGLADWVRLFKATFVFTGPEIVNEFLMSSGYLPGAHRTDCPVFPEARRSLTGG